MADVKLEVIQSVTASCRFLSGRGFLFRRHVSAIQAIKNFTPDFRRIAIFETGINRIDPEIRLLSVRTVALDAVLE